MIIKGLLCNSCVLFNNHHTLNKLVDAWPGWLYVYTMNTHVTVGEEASIPVHMHVVFL